MYILKGISEMKKIVSILCTIMVLSTVMAGCTQRICEYCQSSDVEYEAMFVPSGTKEYLCEACYRERNMNPTFDDFWIVDPI